MELGMIGLGRMGNNMAERLVGAGHRVITYDKDSMAVDASGSFGGEGASSLEDVVSRLASPRAIWSMVPAGPPTQDVIDELAGLLTSGDTILDGGNANYKDSMRRGKSLSERGLNFIDVGTSGGVWGLTEGYSLMVGGDEETVKRLEPIFHALAPGSDKGFSRVAAKNDFALDLPTIAQTWRHGSVVRSWLLDLVAEALKEDPRLESLQSYVDDSGEGRWTVQESVELAVPIPVITASLQARFRSRQDQPLGGRLLAALRNQFGGHSVRKSE